MIKDEKYSFIYELNRDKIVLMDTKQLCFLPYCGHPKGCPNAYGKCWGRRGQISPKRIDKIINIDKPMYIVHSEFNVELFVDKMRRKHPNWSDRQCRNLLYWQGTSRAQLKERVGILMEKMDSSTKLVVKVPEYFGVNVYATCDKVGLILDKIKGLKVCRHIALIGEKK